MIGIFFQQQLDYIFFLYGLAFLLLGGACFLLVYFKDKKLPWLWLGLFGMAHGINEWADLIGFSLGTNYLLSIIKDTFLIFSFLFLVEFGRKVLFIFFKHPRRWIFIPFAIAAASGVVLAKDVGLNITTRYSLGFVGGLFSAFCIWQAGVKADIPSRRLFRILSISIGFYAFTQVIVPRAEFFPARLINQAVFLRFFSLPIQAIRCLLALFMAAWVWNYWTEIPISLDVKGLFEVKKKTLFSVVIVAISIAFAVAGWVVMQKLGKSFDKHEREGVLMDAGGLAMAINPERIKNLKGSSDDLASPDYRRIKEQIGLIHKAMPEYPYICLMGSRLGKVFFFFDSSFSGDGVNAVFPGKLFKEAPRELNKVFSAGKALIGGPFIDKRGTWLNGYAPVKDLTTGEVLAVLGVGIDWAVWNRHILGERFKVILIFGGIWIIFIGSFIIFQIYSTLGQKSAFSEKNFFLVIQSIGDGVIITNMGGKIFLLNLVAENLTGWQTHDALGRDFSEVFPGLNFGICDPVKKTTAEAIESARAKESVGESIFISRDGTKRLIAYNIALMHTEEGEIIGTVTVFRDITKHKKDELQLIENQQKLKMQAQELAVALKESVKSREILSSMLADNNQIREKLERNIEELKRSQYMLIQSEKMSSLGKLVSEIAHEVNNPLMIISGNAELSLILEPVNEEVKKNLKIILEECQVVKDIISRVLKFARPSKGKISEVDINQSIEAIANIIEHPFKLASVEIKRNYLEKLPLIAIDEQLMREVFMNLMCNAKDAMLKGGTITITTFLEGNSLGIDLQDTGFGMSKEVKQKIFDPFFTTKETGTGLGLSICYGIIKAHNGEIRVESELNKGTTFTVLLPLGGGRKA